MLIRKEHMMAYKEWNLQRKKEIFSEHLKQWRCELNMSQESLAQEISCSRETISKWEQGEGLPDWANMFVLEAFFGYSLNDFFEDKKDKEFDSVLKELEDSRLIPVVDISEAKLVYSTDPNANNMLNLPGILEVLEDDEERYIYFVLSNWIRSDLLSSKLQSFSFSGETVTFETEYEYVFQTGDFLSSGERFMLVKDINVFTKDGEKLVPTKIDC